MMVGAPDIDQMVITACQFLLVISYVRGEVCGFTSIPDEDPVLVISVAAC